MSENKGGGAGIGFVGLLTILYIGLKLGGVVTWSWFWVLSPLWIGFSMVVVIILVGLISIALNKKD